MDGNEHVIYHAPHHKTDRRRDSIVYRIPDGVLTDFLLLHIKQGHPAMEQQLGRQPLLFMSGWGQPFNDATFCQSWYIVLGGKWLPGLQSFTPHFAPSKGRNIYVEHVTGVTGFAPDTWEAQVCSAHAYAIGDAICGRGQDDSSVLSSSRAPMVTRPCFLPPVCRASMVTLPCFFPPVCRPRPNHSRMLAHKVNTLTPLCQCRPRQWEHQRARGCPTTQSHSLHGSHNKVWINMCE